MSKKYYLEVEKEHLDVLIRALEFWSRILCGQFSEILKELDNYRSEHIRDKYSDNYRDPLDLALRVLKSYYFSELVNTHGYSSSYSIGKCSGDGCNVKDGHNIAYEFYKVVQRFLALEDNNTPSWSVKIDGPLKVTDIPLPKVSLSKLDELKKKINKI